MKIMLNNHPLTLTKPVTIDTLLTKYDHPRVGVAIAINQNIIPRRQWMEYLVHDGDDILLFRAIAGG